MECCGRRYRVKRATGKRTPVENGGKPPLTYQSFVKIAGQPPPPLGKTFSSLPPVGDLGGYEVFGVPTMEELGYADKTQGEYSPFRGGESEALKRLYRILEDKVWIANFEKPKGDPSTFLKPAMTVLSPYLTIPWSDDDMLFATWRDGQTGFPWIDAIMLQISSVALLPLKCHI